MAGDKEISELSSPLTMNFRYDPSQVTNPDKLAIHWFNPDTEELIRLDSSVDTDNEEISVQVDHWSQFALLEQLPSPGKSKSWIYILSAGIILAGGIVAVVWAKKRRG